MTSDSSFHIISTIRYDPALLVSPENSLPALNFASPSPIYMLVYHRDRLLEAAQHFEFQAVVERLNDGKAFHENIIQKVEEWKVKNGQDGPLRLKVLFSKSGEMRVDIFVTPPVPLSALYPSSLDLQKAASNLHPANDFNPSPLTGGALHLGPEDSFPSQKEDPPAWLLRLDTKPTPSSPVTLLKTSAREQYNISRARALPSNSQAPAKVEVIMYNECNEITEGSITSLYFFRGGRWVTPPVGVPAGEFDALTLKINDHGQNEQPEGSDRWHEGELRKPFAGRWGHSVRSAKVGAGGQRGTTRRWALGKGYCMEEAVGVDTLVEGEGVWVSNALVGFGHGTVVA